MSHLLQNMKLQVYSTKQKQQFQFCIEIGHKQPPMPLTMDNNTTEKFIKIYRSQKN